MASHCSSVNSAGIAAPLKQQSTSVTLASAVPDNSGIHTRISKIIGISIAVISTRTSSRPFSLESTAPATFAIIAPAAMLHPQTAVVDPWLPVNAWIDVLVIIVIEIVVIVLIFIIIIDIWIKSCDQLAIPFILISSFLLPKLSRRICNASCTVIRS